MPEVQTSTVSGEMTQRFIEFVMMHAQQASLFLGRMPNPQTGQAEVRLEVAKLFIDQLEMIQEKTRGNLSSEESEILRHVLSDLQMAFVQASSANPPGAGSSPPAAAAPTGEGASEAPPGPESEPSESKKKFTKSYGA